MPGEKQQLYLETDGQRLHCMLYSPRRHVASIVICPPLFEERKCSARALSETAVALSEVGFSVLKLDYRGCGDSSGAMRDFGPDDWVRDINASLDFLRRRTGGAVGLLGLRLGATLAAFAAERAGGGPLVLWEPVADGREYIEKELQRKLVREMAALGKSRASRREIQKEVSEGRDIDLGGYAVSPGLYEKLRELDISTIPRPAVKTVLLVNIMHRQGFSRAVEAAAACIRKKGVTAETETVICRPFWNRIGYVDASPVIERTSDWLGVQALSN
ncbi:MAG: alpha/beta hydrolase [Kiritimatiellia bacterium]